MRFARQFWRDTVSGANLKIFPIGLVLKLEDHSAVPMHGRCLENAKYFELHQCPGGYNTLLYYRITRDRWCFGVSITEKIRE